MDRLIAGTLALLLVTTLASPALAAWPDPPLPNVPLCTAEGQQSNPQIVADGAGGAMVTIVTRQDYRGVNSSDNGTNSDIYAQGVAAPNRPPDCSHAVASEPVLWPANHQPHAITVGGVTNPSGEHA